MRSDATMKFEIYEIENDKENSGENIRNNKVDNKVDNINLKFEIYLYNKYKDEKDNKRNDKVGNDVTMKFEVYECVRGGM